MPIRRYIIIDKKDDVYLKIEADEDIRRELGQFFTFEVPGFKFMPQYRNRVWDGKIRLYNVMNDVLYHGLLPHLCKFLYLRGYSVNFETNFNTSKIEISPNDLPKLPEIIKPRVYQIEAVNHVLSNKRVLLLSPTASGKSLIIYILVRYLNLKTLILVPTISLVSQMYNDFREYGWDVANNCHTVIAGRDKGSVLPVIISTWQSIYKCNNNILNNMNL